MGRTGTCLPSFMVDFRAPFGLGNAAADICPDHPAGSHWATVAQWLPTGRRGPEHRL
ncbi:hypothetical protein [Kibdelosporangium persicum]|uniref:hypothetical protein n=1 Tax=Kibdelosporangium persicum TaxID=2698649 RepID=UPI001564306F|nr:hypothetical protein [Kibdelosporangium persicum]